MDSALSYIAIIYLIIGIILGLLIGWIGISFRFKGTHISRRQFEDLEKEKNQLYTDLQVLQSKIEEVIQDRTQAEKLQAETQEKYQNLMQSQSATQAELNSLKQNFNQLQEDYKSEKLNKQKVLDENTQLNRFNEGLKADNKNLQHTLETEKKTIEEIQKKFNLEFQNIANKLLEDKSEKFVKLNHEKVDSILKPFKERIQDFEKMVKESYENEMKDKAGLKTEIKKLMELNEVLSKDAQNLTNALKSDTKKQGNWGEVILERVLERSGLEKGSEYIVQHHTRNAEGSSIRPDVVINLPDDKHVVVDSKVSLTAYEAFVSAEEDDQKERMIKNHIQSFRNHVKQLSDKNYDTGAGLNTPDFVLMFVPIESAFSAAVQTDTDLFSYAWDKRIVIVSPSTLLATLRTVASIWKQERQNLNVQEIARLGGEIHDKLVNTMDDLKKVDEDFARMHDRYKDSYKRLYTGKGNVIRTAKKMESLGAKNKKRINPGLLDD